MLKKPTPSLRPPEDLLKDAMKQALPSLSKPTTKSPATVTTVYGIGRTPAAQGSSSTPAKSGNPSGFRMVAETDGDPKGPTAGQKRTLELVSRLPSDFPFDDWDGMSTKEQLVRMRHTNLTDQEQWILLDSSTPLRTLAEQTGWQKDKFSPDTPELTPLEEKLYLKNLEHEQAALSSEPEDNPAGNGTTRYIWPLG